MTTGFSDGIANVLRRLRYPDKEGRSSFPQSWKMEQGHIASIAKPPVEREPIRIHDWFARCVNEYLAGDVGRCKVAENIAIFAVLHWQGDTISYVNCQMLVTINASLEDFYCDDTKKAQYLRLDYDLKKLGAMFREPTPHVHVHPEGEPRFPFIASPNAIIDFFDFVYRNYRYEDWLTWAETVWKKEASLRGLDVFALDRVKQAFDAGNYEAVKGCKADLDYMKQSWRRAKDALWPYWLSGEAVSILSY